MASPISSLAEDFGQLVQKRPDAIAVIDGLSGTEFSYRALDGLLVRAETFLRNKGAERQSPILMLLQNSLEAWILILACLRYGYDLAPFGNTGSEPETAAWRRLVGAKLAICPEGGETAGATAIEVPSDGTLSWLPQADGKAPVPRSCRLMLATSGTTGAPKAMVIDADTLWSAGKAFAREHKFLDGDTRFLNYLPMSYLGGIFNLGLIPMATGGSTVLLEAFNGKSFFSFWQNVERFEANTLWLVPSIARGLLQLEQKTQAAAKGPRKKVFGKVRAAFIGTAPIDLKTKQAFTECFGIALLENYALSETTFLTSESLYGGERLDRSVGKPLPYVELRLAATGADGSPYREIEIKTPFLFKGYLDSNGVLQPPELRDGFFPTKDLARIADDGLVVMGGRTRDIIKKGGYFVGLREIEVVAEQNAAVAEAVAVGVAHDFYGEDYILFVQFKPDSDQAAALADLRTFLTGNLAKQKWPMKVSPVTEIPRTPSGKVIKHRLLDNLGSSAAPIAELP